MIIHNACNKAEVQQRQELDVGQVLATVIGVIGQHSHATSANEIDDCRCNAIFAPMATNGTYLMRL